MHRRLGTEPLTEASPDDPKSPLELALLVRLDRPFHELKEYLVTEFERAYLVRILEESAMNLSMASRSAGLSRKHLRTLISKYSIVLRRGLDVEDADDPPAV